MSKLSRNILISMCAASIITALVINGIIRYKEPTHNTDEIDTKNQRTIQTKLKMHILHLKMQHTIILPHEIMQHKSVKTR